MIKLFATRYRVVEETKGDGRVKFYPQDWKFIGGWRDLDLSYRTLEKANEVIQEDIDDRRKSKTAGRKIHSFNEVFHKLKK